MVSPHSELDWTRSSTTMSTHFLWMKSIDSPLKSRDRLTIWRIRQSDQSAIGHGSFPGETPLVVWRVSQSPIITVKIRDRHRSSFPSCCLFYNNNKNNNKNMFIHDVIYEYIYIVYKSLIIKKMWYKSISYSPIYLFMILKKI